MNFFKKTGVLFVVLSQLLLMGVANASSSLSERIEAWRGFLPDTSDYKIVSQKDFGDIVASSTALIADHQLAQEVVQKCPGNELVQSVGDQGQVQITMLKTQDGTTVLHILGKKQFRDSALYVVVDDKVLAITAGEFETTLRDKQAAIVASQFNKGCAGALVDSLDHIMEGTGLTIDDARRMEVEGFYPL